MNKLDKAIAYARKYTNILYDTRTAKIVERVKVEIEKIFADSEEDCTQEKEDILVCAALSDVIQLQGIHVKGIRTEFGDDISDVVNKLFPALILEINLDKVIEDEVAALITVCDLEEKLSNTTDLEKRKFLLLSIKYIKMGVAYKTVCSMLI